MSAHKVIALAMLLAAGLFAAGFLVEPVPVRAQATGKPAPAATAEAAPEAADLLFDEPQFSHAPPGTPLVYRYDRKVSDPELGPSFDDRIRLLVEASNGSDDARNVKVDLFTGERHRAAGPFEAVTTNPALLIFLENHLETLSSRLSGNPGYFKNAIRLALRDKAIVAPVELSVGGRSFKGWRVTVSPFKGDANARRMRGLDSLTYRFEVAPDLPGEIAKIEITAEAPGGRLWQESIAYDPKGS